MKDILLNATIQRMLVGAFAIVLLVGVAIGKHFYPDLDPTIVGIIVSVGITLLTSVGVYHVSGGANKQQGRSSLAMLLLVATVALLAACAAPMNAAVSGLMTQEASNIRGTDDNLGKATVWSFCHMPFEWHQRHPEYQKARDTLCGPMASDPNAIDVQQLNALVTVLRAAGVTLQASPAK